MLTRKHVFHTSAPVQPAQVVVPGIVRTERVNNITQTWAVSRPMSSPSPAGGAPFYLGMATPPNILVHGGALNVIPARPRVEMDPSDSDTWQREYRFTH